MSASNTRECIEDFFGKKLTGVLFGELPFSNREIASHTKALIFDDGTALVLSDNGSFWAAAPDEVRLALDRKRRELEAASHEIRSVLAAAGDPHA